MYCTLPLSSRKGRLRSFRDDDDDDEARRPLCCQVRDRSWLAMPGVPYWHFLCRLLYRFVVIHCFRLVIIFTYLVYYYLVYVYLVCEVIRKNIIGVETVVNISLTTAAEYFIVIVWV